MSPQPLLTLYSKPGCHLCEDMKAIIGRVAESVPLRLEEIDISTDAELERLYALEIPVLLIDGRKAAKYRIREQDLRRILQGRKPWKSLHGSKAEGSG